MPCADRAMLNGLLISLAIFRLVACSPLGENPSPLDIQRGPSSPYDVEANWICLREVNAQRSACPQRVLPASADKELRYAYTNVGLATIPERAVVTVIWIDGKIVAQDYGNSSPMEPGKEQVAGWDSRVFRRADKGEGTYEVMLELKFSEKYEEANTDDNVVVQMVEVRE